MSSIPQGDGSAEDGAGKPCSAVCLPFLGATTYDDVPAREVFTALAI